MLGDCPHPKVEETMKRLQRTGNQAARCRFYTGNPGFTLVEMLVVISIIGVLAGLVTVAAMAAKRAANRALITTDLSQLYASLQTFRNKYGAYPPDGTVYPSFPEYDANHNGIPDEFERFFQTAFPRANLMSELDILKNKCNISGTGYSMFFVDPNNENVSFYTPQTAMAFWLGGMPEDVVDNIKNPNPNFVPNPKSPLIGFSKNPINPLTDTASTSRIVYFDFKGEYLRNPSSATATSYLFRAYLPPVKIATEEPYIYFRAEPGQRGYEYFVSPLKTTAVQNKMKASRDLNMNPIARPYYDTRTNAFVNRSDCQVLCAGLDGLFFTNNPSTGSPLGLRDLRFLAFPGGMDGAVTRSPFNFSLLHYDNANRDDQANFVNGAIGDAGP
jgi:prepilin-type N-terminal cleavage/methylation domain-containing protein